VTDNKLERIFGRKQSWPNFKVLSRYMPRTEGTTKNFNPDSRSPGQDLKPGSPKYEAGVLTTRPQRSVLPVEVGEYYRGFLHYFKQWRW
jgi:hypothetical protein